MCPKNEHLNDEAREKFLERHNSLRYVHKAELSLSLVGNV